jgi:hypothetical protein
MHKPDQDLPWPPPVHRPSRADLAAPATQIVRDREDYLGQGLRDIGRRIADDQVELFVTGEAAPALQQQLERLAPQYIALHDLGTSASLHLLNSLAGAAGAPVQRLSIRRQGQGVALAVLQFVEVPLGDGNHARIYTTDVNADGAQRQQLAMVLLARSRLSVLMLGDVPASALMNALAPVRDAMTRVNWTNRDMLVLPLGSAAALAAQAGQMLGVGGMNVRVTPQASRPNDAWSFVSGAWNRQQVPAGRSAVLNTELSQALPRPAVPMPEAPTEPMPLEPPPPPPPQRNQLLTPSAAHHWADQLTPAAPQRWSDYAHRCVAIKGVLSCCVFDLRTQQSLAHAGGPPTGERLALQGGLLIDAIANAAKALNLGSAAPEAAISIGQQHMVLRPVPGHPGLVLHLVLQASANNLTLARMQLDRVAPPA